jgi:hypothetical protein
MVAFRWFRELWEFPIAPVIISAINYDPANTGMNAKRNAQGEYVLDPNGQEARALADQVNFGTFPAQYSTGALTRYKILDKKVVQNLRWKDFNPKIDLSKFSTPDGDSLPENIQLFDKNFSDVLLKV